MQDVIPESKKRRRINKRAKKEKEMKQFFNKNSN
jgi:hypothetical protein